MSPADCGSGDGDEGRKARPELVEGQIPQVSGDVASGNLGEMFSYVAFAQNRYIIDHMLRFSRHFGFDFETMVIWGGWPTRTWPI